MDDHRVILVATRSPHKLGELRELLRLPRTTLVGLDEAGVQGEVVEDGRTFRDNALLKARFGAAQTSLPTLADDSGIEVDALGGAPGVRTRRYAGEVATDEENNAKLLRALQGMSPESRTARYRCVLAFVEPASGPGRPPRVLTRSGVFEGRIALDGRGAGGFGYDPIFEPATEPPGGRTVAQLSPAEKNRFSHRGRAARAIMTELRRRGY